MLDLAEMTTDDLRSLRDRVETILAERELQEKEIPSTREIVETRPAPRGTLRREKVRCGKKGCKKCKEGPAHGPYWYLYYYRNGRLTSKYIGKELTKDLERFSPTSDMAN
jgi:hypothetical protein